MGITDKNLLRDRILKALFVVLYTGVGTVSMVHATTFFSLGNAFWAACVLAASFEVGQAVTLFAMLTGRGRGWIGWALMVILTGVQVMGNVYSSFRHAGTLTGNELSDWAASVLFAFGDVSPAAQSVSLAYVQGAILPAVALMITAIVAPRKGDAGPPQVTEKRTETFDF